MDLGWSTEFRADRLPLGSLLITNSRTNSVISNVPHSVNCLRLPSQRHKFRNRRSDAVNDNCDNRVTRATWLDRQGLIAAFPLLKCAKTFTANADKRRIFFSNSKRNWLRNKLNKNLNFSCDITSSRSSSVFLQTTNTQTKSTSYFFADSDVVKKSSEHQLSLTLRECEIFVHVKNHAYLLLDTHIHKCPMRLVDFSEVCIVLWPWWLCTICAQKNLKTFTSYPIPLAAPWCSRIFLYSSKSLSSSAVLTRQVYVVALPVMWYRLNGNGWRRALQFCQDGRADPSMRCSLSSSSQITRETLFIVTLQSASSWHSMQRFSANSETNSASTLS